MGQIKLLMIKVKKYLLKKPSKIEWVLLAFVILFILYKFSIRIKESYHNAPVGDFGPTPFELHQEYKDKLK